MCYLNIEQSYIIYFGLALFDREHTMQLDTVLRDIGLAKYISEDESVAGVIKEGQRTEERGD